MTEREIEINKLIAQWIMDLIELVSYVDGNRISVGWGKDENREIIYKSLSLPHYSTNIQDAWPIFEMLAKDYDYQISYYFNWTVFNKRFPDGTPNGISANTAPMAICLAALDRIGVKV